MDGQNVEIYIPKFRKYLDEFTLKKLRAHEQKYGSTPELVRSRSGATPKKILLEEDEDKDKDNNPPTPQKGDGISYSESFEKWWLLYPKKRGKKAAFKNWQSIGKKKEATVIELMDSLSAQIEAGHFISADGTDYTPDPERWLSKGRWQDEIKPKATNNPNHKIYKAGDKRYAD